MIGDLSLLADLIHDKFCFPLGKKGNQEDQWSGDELVDREEDVKINEGQTGVGRTWKRSRQLNEDGCWNGAGSWRAIWF